MIFLVGEARGAVFGLQTAANLGLSSIVLEGDSSTVMEALKSKTHLALGKLL